MAGVASLSFWPRLIVNTVLPAIRASAVNDIGKEEQHGTADPKKQEPEAHNDKIGVR